MDQLLQRFRAGLARSSSASRRVWALAALATLPAGVRAAPSLVDPGADSGINFAEATCVNADGTVVAGRSGRPFRWTEAGGRVRLNTFLGANGGYVEDISADGSWAVGSQYTDFAGNVPIRWGPSGSAQRVDSWQTSFTWSAANGVSAEGRVIVGEYYISQSVTLAFIWSQSAGMQFLGTLPEATFSEATAVSDDGSIVAGSSGTAFVWSSATGMIDLGSYAGLPRSTVTALSSDGRVAVGYASDFGTNVVALMWRDGVLQPPLVNFPNVTDSFATGTNRDGTVVVGYYNHWTSPRAFIWTPENGAVDLTAYAQSIGIDLGAQRLAYAHDISDDGSTIVGRYTTPPGYRAFILRDLPLGDNRCPPCAADFDEDGGVTGADLAAFMGAFEAGARCADVDDDDQIDGKDVATFLAAFEHGACV